MRRMQRNNLEVVQAGGELDLSNAGDLRTLLESAVSQGQGDVVLDITEAAYIDSAILQELVRAFNLLSGENRRFVVLAKEGAQPWQVLHTVQFNTIMKIVGNWSEIEG
jgi:anti-anti-sigma factor